MFQEVEFSAVNCLSGHRLCVVMNVSMWLWVAMEMKLAGADTESYYREKRLRFEISNSLNFF